MGLLSGKYRAGGEGRLNRDNAEGLGLFTERNMRIVAALSEVSDAVGKSMAQIALNWVVTQPGIGAAIIGASKLTQLDDNLGALAFTIPDELRMKLDEASAIQPTYPYSLLSRTIRRASSIRALQLAISHTVICLRNSCPRLVTTLSANPPKNSEISERTIMNDMPVKVQPVASIDPTLLF